MSIALICFLIEKTTIIWLGAEYSDFHLKGPLHERNLQFLKNGYVGDYSYPNSMTTQLDT